MSHSKKIKLKKRSEQSIRIRKGFVMPVGRVGDDNAVSFRDFADLKAKYFTFTGRVPRRPFILRILILAFAQFMFSLILYSRFAESLIVQQLGFAAVFLLVFIVMTIPVVWSQLSLGVRRCHDMNRTGFFFAIPYVCYIVSYAAPVLGLETVSFVAQTITVISFLAFFAIKGTDGDNAYGTRQTRQ